MSNEGEQPTSVEELLNPTWTYGVDWAEKIDDHTSVYAAKIKDEMKQKMAEAIEKLIAEERRQAKIQELESYPLNWAQNRKDKTWETMILSRLTTLRGENNE